MAKKFKTLRDNMSKASLAKAEKIFSETIQEMALNDLRKALGLTQEELASRLQMKQASVSKLEHQADLYVSTLRRFVEACGGNLVINAVFPSGTIRIDQFCQTPNNSSTLTNS